MDTSNRNVGGEDSSSRGKIESAGVQGSIGGCGGIAHLGEASRVYYTTDYLTQCLV